MASLTLGVWQVVAGNQTCTNTARKLEYADAVAPHKKKKYA
jgi:hypothetical protein